MAEAEKTFCVRHPNVETNLRCASCGDAICPKCLVQAPVGMKCRRCGANSNAALYKPSLLQGTCAATVGLTSGAVAGWAVQFQIGFLTLFLAVAYGGFVGEAILRASGRKRGPQLELIAAVALLAGAVGARMVVAGLLLSSGSAVRPPHGVWDVLIDLVKPSPMPLVALIIVLAAAISRIRHLW